MYYGFAHKQRGHSHITNGTPCQDAADWKKYEDYAIAAVSDGHGGEKYFRSATGSSLAVSVAIRCLQEFLEKYRVRLKDLGEREKHLSGIEARIINEWQNEIEKDFTKNPLLPHEKEICSQYCMSFDTCQPHFYGSTLLYACMTPEYSFASQIGDGACVFLYLDATPNMPVPEDPRLGFGATTSLCNSDALDSFRHSFGDAAKGLPRAIFLSTDGIVDSYRRESFLRINQKIFDEMNENKENAEKLIEEWLPALSEKGSRDDVSIAGIYLPAAPFMQFSELDFTPGDFFTQQSKR